MLKRNMWDILHVRTTSILIHSQGSPDVHVIPYMYHVQCPNWQGNGTNGGVLGGNHWMWYMWASKKEKVRLDFLSFNGIMVFEIYLNYIMY